MFSNLDPIIQKVEKFNIHTNIYGLSRSIIAFSLFLTLMINPHDVLFPGNLGYDGEVMLGLRKYSIFHLLESDLSLARWISIAILLPVMLGWRPQWTGLLHWWIAFSFFLSCPVVDGGDQIGAILSFLFIPFTLSDPRKWHWNHIQHQNSFYIKSINYLFYQCIRLQASIIYFFAAAEKLAVPEWKNGTVIYYWLNHSTFGMNESFKVLVDPIIESPAVAIITWSVLVLEVLLSMALLASKRIKSILLPIGIGFHFAILIFHGLFTFFFYMTALLIIYLWPANRSFVLIRNKLLLKFRLLFPPRV